MNKNTSSIGSSNKYIIPVPLNVHMLQFIPFSRLTVEKSTMSDNCQGLKTRLMLHAMSWHNATYVKHTEWWAARRTWASTTQPDLWLHLILSTGEPSAHALQAPHRSTLAAATCWCSVSVVGTTSSQLDAGYSLHATHALIQQLHTQTAFVKESCKCLPSNNTGIYTLALIHKEHLHNTGKHLLLPLSTLCITNPQQAPTKTVKD